MIIPNNIISHIGKIFNGEYDIPYYKKSPVILDIGANIGGFSVWASERWNNSTIFSYEPVKENFNLLEENTKNIKNIKLYNYAIGSCDCERYIHYGKNNCGEASFFYNSNYQQQNRELVLVKSSKNLPKADIVKIDVEGLEIEILKSMIIEPDVIIVEYHSFNGIESHITLSKILKNYIPYSIDKVKECTGVIKYFHKDFCFDDFNVSLSTNKEIFKNQFNYS